MLAQLEDFDVHVVLYPSSGRLTLTVPEGDELKGDWNKVLTQALVCIL
jgi:hypothetical protein